MNNQKIMKNLLIFLIIVSLINNLFAKDVLPIKKGEQAPFDGVVFTTKKAQDVRKELIEKDQLKIFNETLREQIQIKNEIITNKEKQVVLLENQNTKLAEELENEKKTKTTERIIWFGLGVLATGVAAYGTSKLLGK